MCRLKWPSGNFDKLRNVARNDSFVIYLVFCNKLINSLCTFGFPTQFRLIVLVKNVLDP